MKSKMVLFALLVGACGPVDSAPVPCTASSYPSDGFEARAVRGLALRQNFNALNEVMEEALADPTKKVTVSEMDAQWSFGNPSLKSVSTEAFLPVMADIFARFESASGNTWLPGDPPVGTGGLFSKWMFSAEGIDLQEFAEKGMFGAVQYAEAASLLNSDATVNDIDDVLALFGAHPSFPMDDKAAVNPDVHLAAYAKRRTAAQSQGPYLIIKDAFINARAAVAGGTACTAQRDAAFAEIRHQWEKAMLGTAYFYVTAATKTLEAASVSSSDQASALHRIGEAVGFLWGLKMVPSSQRTATDVQLDAALTLLGANNLSNVTVYRFVTSPSVSVDALTDAATAIQAAGAFTSDEMTTFKNNY